MRRFEFKFVYLRRYYDAKLLTLGHSNIFDGACLIATLCPKGHEVGRHLDN